MKQDLIDSGVSPTQVELIDMVLKFGGKRRRSPGLYGDRSFMSRMAKNLSTGLSGVENVYTQHVPLMMNTVDAALKGKLRETHFPFVGPSSDSRPRKIVVFIVGGVTYEEATKVFELNSSSAGVQVLLGGTSVQNSTSFLKELSAVEVSAYA
uniref:Uncharacterized protein n=2 Tax=Octactis speculum TaxID=3111310 RepID=A0A7S2AKP4_9STRA|mmetsp:Transcript_11548/g.15264  ORF Transcript_11548/g.15264 Transcript_11548/m.15264 type:complete len:152 (+) Transcript_11548:142-597(+)